jgi:hypothetical protein
VFPSCSGSKCSLLAVPCHPVVASHQSQVSPRALRLVILCKYLNISFIASCPLIMCRFVSGALILMLVPITRVGPHINAAQRDLPDYQSLVAHPQNRTRVQVCNLDIYSPSSYSIRSFIHCIANMVGKLLSLCLLVVASLALVQAGTFTS